MNHLPLDARLVAARNGGATAEYAFAPRRAICGSGGVVDGALVNADGAVVDLHWLDDTRTGPDSAVWMPADRVHVHPDHR